jgi:hypothetical protein
MDKWSRQSIIRDKSETFERLPKCTLHKTAENFQQIIENQLKSFALKFQKKFTTQSDGKVERAKVFFMEIHKFFLLHNTEQIQLFLFYLFLINAFSFFTFVQHFFLRAFYDFFLSIFKV